jgi:hypothetical protein
MEVLLPGKKQESKLKNNWLLTYIPLSIKLDTATVIPKSLDLAWIGCSNKKVIGFANARFLSIFTSQKIVPTQ